MGEFNLEYNIWVTRHLHSVNLESLHFYSWYLSTWQIHLYFYVLGIRCWRWCWFLQKTHIEWWRLTNFTWVASWTNKLVSEMHSLVRTMDWRNNWSVLFWWQNWQSRCCQWYTYWKIINNFFMKKNYGKFC